MRLSKSESFFNPEESERVKQAIAAAEARTVGEIAVMVVDESDAYEEAAVTGGLCLGGAAAFVVTILRFGSSVWWFVPLALVLGCAARPLLRLWPALKLIFVADAREEEAVRERAVRAFYEKGLHRTRGETGVLLFFSLLERRVWVLADRGIYARISQADLDAFAVELSRGVRQGRAAEALVKAIGGAGELLARHFPVTGDNPQELPDDIITT
jgi:putative membrane protein